MSGQRKLNIIRRIRQAKEDIKLQASRIPSYLKGRKAKARTKIIKEARAWKGAPDFKDDELTPTRAYKARIMANKIREEIKRKPMK